MITTGIEKKVEALKTRLIEHVKRHRPNSLEEFAALCSAEDADLLDEMERLNGPDNCNVWLVNLLVSTGLYEEAGKGFVTLVASEMN